MPAMSMFSRQAPARNADPAELAKFSEAAHRWWDPESEFKPLHQINPLRLPGWPRLPACKGKRALDVGCGGGLLAEAMARQGGAAEVLGIDLSSKALGVAQLHAHGSRGDEPELPRGAGRAALAAEQPAARSTW